MTMSDDNEYAGGCCSGCCRAPDLGVHDYCLPCATNPTCTRPSPRYTATGVSQRAVSHSDRGFPTRMPFRPITAETEARVVTKKQQDDVHHLDKSKKNRDEPRHGKSVEDTKQLSRHHKHREGRGKKNKEDASVEMIKGP